MLRNCTSVQPSVHKKSAGNRDFCPPATTSASASCSTGARRCSRGWRRTSTRRARASGGEYVATPSWWRAPYIASFRAGSFDFDLARRAHPLGRRRQAGRAAAAPRNPPAGGLGREACPSQPRPDRRRRLQHPQHRQSPVPGHHRARPAHAQGAARRARLEPRAEQTLRPDPASQREFTYEMSDHLPLWVQVRTG